MVAQHPDIYIPSLFAGGSLTFGKQFNGSAGQWPASFCHRESGFLTNIKGLASYTVPKLDVLLSGTWHSVPYPGNNFPSITSQSLGGLLLAVPIAQTNLGRPLASGSPVEFLNLVEPGKLNYERLSQADMRIGKNLRYGRTKTLVALDIFNLFNSNNPGRVQHHVLRSGRDLDVSEPRSITVGRFFKISAQFDF
jgi:hypothetical protein